MRGNFPLQLDVMLGGGFHSSSVLCLVVVSIAARCCAWLYDDLNTIGGFHYNLALCLFNDDLKRGGGFHCSSVLYLVCD